MKNPVDSSELTRILAEIQAKLTAPALNGGFDTLMYKVEKIEEAQEKILEEVSDLKDAMYDPDEGLFARIRDAEESSKEETKVLSTAVTQLVAWKDIEVSKTSELKSSTKENENSIRDLQLKLDDLVEWKTRINSTVKWIIVTVSTSAIGLISKALFEMYSRSK